VSFEERARKLAAKAMDKLEAALDSGDPDLSTRAAQQILDRAFGRPGVSRSDLEARKLEAEVKVLEKAASATTPEPVAVGSEDFASSMRREFGQEPVIYDGIGPDKSTKH
jgi:hypothetical protein